MRQRFGRGLAVLGLLAVALAGAPRAAGAAPPREACFAETNHCAARAFLDYWANSGGLESLGFPIDQMRRSPDGSIRQFYERAILEWHPENGPQFQVLLTRLGAAAIAGHPRAQQPPEPCGTGCTLFRETNHTMRGEFRTYWAAHGGLAVFGYPLTEAYEEISAVDGRRYLVQYYERNRFELHPEAQVRYRVLLGLLGREALAALGGREEAQPIAQVPDYGEAEQDTGAVVLPQQGYAGTPFAIICVGLVPGTRYTLVIAPFLPPGSLSPPPVATRTLTTPADGRLDLTLDSAGLPPGPYRIDAFRPDGTGHFLGEFAVLAR
jgi:hypothetical protein